MCHTCSTPFLIYHHIPTLPLHPFSDVKVYLPPRVTSNAYTRKLSPDLLSYAFQILLFISTYRNTPATPGWIHRAPVGPQLSQSYNPVPYPTALICRTGHWLNHGKEHCLVGMKGNPKDLNRGLDSDVIVAEVRATSHKPDEIYGMIERFVASNLAR
ncbi:hypothetical protein HUJ04_012894 [Dendroctonus ponderosae]|nr:hypothetical protein HUJ04_012894 [Dendroctonus ponderosae]